jgi:hypothetical protein
MDTVNEMKGEGRKGTYTPFRRFTFVNIEVDTREFGPKERAIPEVGIDRDC